MMYNIKGPEFFKLSTIYDRNELEKKKEKSDKCVRYVFSSFSK